MDLLLTAVGILVILAGLVDMFHTLLHPSGRGRLSLPVLAGIWKLSKATGHRLGSAVGPVAMTTIFLLWVLLQAVGWALVYYPHIPDGFAYASGIRAADYNNFAEAVYISLMSLTTLGLGDVVPTDPWVRLASPLEALAGFSLLTAALTWFTQIYPPLSRRRSLALELKSLAELGYARSLNTIDSGAAARTLDALAGEVGKVRVDFTQHGEGFYFQEPDPDLSLARQLPYALVLRDAAAGSSSEQVRSSGMRLASALDELGGKLGKVFLKPGATVEDVFAAYAAEHGEPFDATS